MEISDTFRFSLQKSRPMEPTMDYPFDVFLSHNKADKPRVRRLAEQLRAAGLRVWFDEWIIKPGDDIYLAIERGLETSRTLVLCMSPAAFGSDWVGLERSTVLFRDPSNAGRRFIPLLLADCTPPDTLRRYSYVDFRREAKTAFEELVRACRPEAEATPPAGPTKPEKMAKPAKKSDEPEPLAVLERTLTGHTDWVTSVAVSPDGKWVASGSHDQTVKVWDLETGECRATLKGHTNQVWCVAITPDAKRIVSASHDKTIRVWDLDTARQLVVCKGHTSEVWCVAVFPDGQRALSGSSDRMLRLWDIHSGKCIKEIEGSDASCLSVAITRDSKRRVSGHAGGQVRVSNLETGESLAILKGHASNVRSVQITPDGRHAVSGSSDKTVKIWDLENGTCLGTLEGHHNIVYSVAISPDGTLIACAVPSDQAVRLWDRSLGACLQLIERKEHFSPASVTFSPDGSRLVVGSINPSVIYVYRLTGARAAPTAEPTRRYVNAKVVLVGESGVGKSGLAHRLIQDRFVKTESTHGMQVWRLDLPLEPEGDLEREALLWDLAGQEDYRLIHQLFLDETALALMLFNPQKDDPFAEVGDWLKVLIAAVPREQAREVAKLLIAGRVDVGGVKLGQRKIDRFLKDHGLAAYLGTSAKRGDNCSDQQNGGKASTLKGLIVKHIPWDKLPWTSSPRLLADLKHAVIEMTEQKRLRLLRFAELAQRLEQALPKEKISESDVRTAVTLLANHGLVMPLKFGDLVLLRPEMVNGYAAAVIRAAREHTDEIGCVKEQDVFDSTINLSGVDRLDPADEELLVRAMVKIFLERSLCIAEDTPEGRHLIFPSQFRRERPIPTHPEIFVSYTFSGEWQTIYTTLVVRLWYSREFQHRELWRNAAEFATSKGRTIGLLMDRTGEGEGTISVFFDTDVPDELKVVFIEYVHRHLDKYARDVRRDRRYICQACGKPVTDLAAVRERFEAKKDFIYCQKCDEKVLLIDHIEQRLASDPVARRVLGMDQKATQELDTQALEQILIGHMMAICGEANQIFRELTKFDYGIDGEVEFKDNDGKASGKKIYVQLKSGASYLRTRKSDEQEIFDVSKPRHLDYWVSQPVDVYLVIRDAEETIRWMNVTRYLKQRPDKQSRQIVFSGEKLDAPAGSQDVALG
jgi:WD40 repeat protein/DNA-directed RNA polymerase subunit RPC12/RpoP